MNKEKTVTMSYYEHQEWIRERAEYDKELIKCAENAKKLEDSYKEAIEEKGVVYVQTGQVVIGKERVHHHYHGYELRDKYFSYLRLVPEDTVLSGFKESNQELHRIINQLRTDKIELERELERSQIKQANYKGMIKRLVEELPKRFQKKFKNWI